jgi:asparagine synthase (glutamine-hydrolysing)
MCGLVGIARVDGRPLDGEAHRTIRRMARAVAHRGPDDESYHEADRVALGFVRLSLVDPQGGAQPLVVDDGSLVLIANGEIYNHAALEAGLPAGTRLRTRSDCEVLLHLYRRDGLSFLDEVRGIFSLVLYDRTRERVVFARDRFGVKPLYYHLGDGRVAFASELKALFEDPACPRRLDWEAALRDQKMSGAPVFDVSPAHAWFEDVALVPAATIVGIDLADGRVSHHRYWDFPSFAGTADASEQELVDEYGRLLASSVADSDMADVEIGLFLSGGIDSAAVAALSSVRPRTFTALNGSTLANGDAESGHRIARTLGLDNHQILFDTAHVPGVEEWKRHLWLLETPLAGPESFYKYEMYRYVADRAPEIKAMLLGGGADEFNGGYSAIMAEGGGWSDLEANLGRMASGVDRGRRPDLGVWWQQPGVPLLNADALRHLAGGPRLDPYETFFRWKYRDVQLYNCWHEDRTAAGNGIEARVPFLDHRLIELVASVPRHLRPTLVWDKQILRRAMRGTLPPWMTERPKGPFFYGEGVRYTYRAFAAMLARDGDRLLEEALSGPGAREWLNPDALRAALRNVERDPEDPHLEFLLRAVNLGLLEQMAARLPSPHVDSLPAPTPVRVEVTDWESQREHIEARVLRRAPVTDDLVLGLADGTMLVHGPPDPDTWYLIVDGAIEYVLDGALEPAWVNLLLALDGRRSLGEIIASDRLDPGLVRPRIAEAVELGLVTAVTPEVHPAPAGAADRQEEGVSA